MEKGSQLANPKAAEVTEDSKQATAKRAQRYCGNCGKPGHNRHTCIEEVSDIE